MTGSSLSVIVTVGRATSHRGRWTESTQPNRHGYAHQVCTATNTCGTKLSSNDSGEPNASPQLHDALPMEKASVVREKLGEEDFFYEKFGYSYDWVMVFGIEEEDPDVADEQFDDVDEDVPAQSHRGL